MKLSKNVGILAESRLTNGNFEYRSFKIEVKATDLSVVKEVTFPYNINIIRGRYLDTTPMEGDQLLVEVNPKKIAGCVTVDSISTILQVNDTVFKHVDVGHKIYITDGSTSDYLGRCLSKVNVNEIIVETEPSKVYPAGSYIQYTVPLVENLHLMGANVERVIEGTSKSSFLPANVPIVLKYINNTGTDKDFIFDFEILF